jgi:hypothetical protein
VREPTIVLPGGLEDDANWRVESMKVNRTPKEFKLALEGSQP